MVEVPPVWTPVKVCGSGRIKCTSFTECGIGGSVSIFVAPHHCCHRLAGSGGSSVIGVHVQ